MITIISFVTVVLQSHPLGVAQPSCYFHLGFPCISRHTFVVCIAAFWPTCWIHDMRYRKSSSRVFLFWIQHFFLLCCILLNVLWPLCVFCTLWEQHNRFVESTINFCFLDIYYFFYSCLSYYDATYTFIQTLCITYDRCAWTHHLSAAHLSSSIFGCLILFQKELDREIC